MKSELEVLLDRIEKSIEHATMKYNFELGITLNVLEDLLWNLNNNAAQRCNTLQRKIFDRSAE